MIENRLFTSESVTEGHPDKVCDQISDAILDNILTQDSNARVACEVLATTGTIFISGEITTDAIVDYKKIALDTLLKIGYTKPEYGIEIDKLDIQTNIDVQSPNIAQGVDKLEGNEQGAGDQGLMFGYACNETKELMPLPIQLAHHLTKKLSQVRKTRKLDWLRPDGKSQVTVEYQDNIPVRIKKVVIATQHDDMLDRFGSEESEHQFIYENIIKEVILPILNLYSINHDNDFIINGTGRFVVGGPTADTGLTGRKIIVDTYGGYARHGGGAFSGKDPSKVDRSSAYMARYIAKNIVAANLASHCEIQIAYSIGVAEPVSLSVDTMGTGILEDIELTKLVHMIFPVKPEKIIHHLNLKKPIYQKLASYGHFGREGYTWENLDMVEKLLEYSKGVGIE